MDIKFALANEHSKQLTIKICKYIRSNAHKFAKLMKIFLSNDYRLAQRASWVVNYCTEKNPKLILPYLDKIVDNLEKTEVHDAVKRNALRAMQFIEIPSKHLGKATDSCFKILMDENEAVAVRVFAMTVIYNISEKEPDIKNELKICIEQLLTLPHKPAIASRGKKTLKLLAKNRAR